MVSLPAFALYNLVKFIVCFVRALKGLILYIFFRF